MAKKRSTKMNIKKEKNGESTKLFLSGSIDVPGAESFKKSLSEELDSGVKEVILDFTEVNFVGSSGIGKLLVFYKNFTTMGGKIRIMNLKEEIRDLFIAIKLDKIFDF
jgi:anti-sigma B factor antagonist